MEISFIFLTIKSTCYSAVSYTHLDVYKRQIRTDPVRKYEWLNEIFYASA